MALPMQKCSQVKSGCPASLHEETLWNLEMSHSSHFFVNYLVGKLFLISGLKGGWWVVGSPCIAYVRIFKTTMPLH